MKSHRNTKTLRQDPLLARENRVSESIIQCAIEVHRILGPGLREAAYEAALAREMDLVGIQ